MSLKSIRIEDERIEAVKQWPEPQSVWDIQVFLGFANFYQRFIQGFSQIAALLISMLKTLSTESAKPRKGVVGVGGDSKAGRDRGELDRSGIDNIKVDNGEVEDDEVRKKGWKTSKNLSKSKKTIGSDFLTFRARLAFAKLRQTFVKAPILHHFDPKYHIWVEIDVSGNAISGVPSQLTLDDLGQWHPVTFFFQKMIPAKTRYETHDGELLAIVEAFKT